eukprot:CAMPEP_0177659396 /NCGR_PEP_ID=MMETSP0447-20121125/17420_1 /TAXON_ID=0 /ORGANISM="Stygamoeba regulata, Strain BSH-02190019" /LENGTH=429 /DNA_ID=CAMNT_0019164263 /DNA_START=79 /DNA_END=1368 /DNA_ORIENTATION=-
MPRPLLLILLAAVCCAAAALAATDARVFINTAGAPTSPVAAQGVYAAGWLVTSTQYGVLADGSLVPGGAGPQMEQALRNLEAIFAAAGLTIARHATSCWLFFVDVDTNFNAASDVYKTHFPHLPHPTRTPIGGAFAAPAPGAVVGVRCDGALEPSRRVAPPNFFPTDFNSQGMVVKSALLHTAGQVGADPMSGEMVAGGAAAEATQAMQNLQTVFAAAYPALGSGALDRLAVDCQVMVAQPASNLPLVQAAVAKFFSSPFPLSLLGGLDPGFGANVEITCTGGDARMQRVAVEVEGERLGMALVSEEEVHVFIAPKVFTDSSSVRDQTYLAFEAVVDAMRLALPSNTTFWDAAMHCTLFVAAPADAEAAMAAYGEMWWFKPKPAFSLVTGTRLPLGAMVAVQCRGFQQVRRDSVLQKAQRETPDHMEAD